jgi:hypothetical protein
MSLSYEQSAHLFHKMQQPYHHKIDDPKQRLFDVGYMLAIVEWLRQRGHFDDFCEEQLRAGHDAARDDLRANIHPYTDDLLRLTRLREWDIDPVYHDWLRSFGLRILSSENHIHPKRNVQFSVA